MNFVAAHVYTGGVCVVYDKRTGMAVHSYRPSQMKLARLMADKLNREQVRS
jgi:hypothetical protein